MCDPVAIYLIVLGLFLQVFFTSLLFFFFKDLFILNLFLAVLGLCCCGLSSWQQAGDTLCYCAQASHCVGFSCCRTWALGWLQ